MKTPFLTILTIVTGLPAAALPARGAPPSPATAAEIRSLIGRAGEAKDHGKAPVIVVLAEDDVHVQKSGLALTERCRVVKLLTDAGVRSQSVLRERYDPNTYRVSVDAVRIHRRNGAVEEVPLEGIVSRPARQGSIFWGGRQLLLSLPRLSVGDAVEVRSRRIGYNIAYLADDGAAEPLTGEGLVPPMPGHWFQVERFQGSRPILRKRFSVHLPEGKPLQFEVYGGALRTSLWHEAGGDVYTFVAEDVPALKGESSMVSRDDCVPKVVMTTVPSWEEKSRWFYRVNEHQFEADDAIRAKVAELTKGLPDDEARIAACLHWVSDHIRYVGTTRGPREGFTLHRGIETYRDRGGVCKDIAGMLITMLRALGMDACPTLTMAGPRVEDIPADQFNHTVCALRRPDGTFRMLDPTWSPVSRELWSSREALQGIVVGSPEGSTLALSPYFPPEANTLRIRAESRIGGADLTLRTGLEFDLCGYPGTYLRRYLNRHPRQERPGDVEEVLAIAPNARLLSLEYTDPLDYSENAHASISVAAPRYAVGSGEVVSFPLPLLGHPLGKWLMPDLLNPPKEKERRYGLRLRATRLVTYENRIRLPEGWKVASLPKPRRIDTGAARLTFSAKAKGPEIRVRFTLRVPHHIVSPTAYPDFRRVIAAASALRRERVVCTPGETGATPEARPAAPGNASPPDAVVESLAEDYALDPDGTMRRRVRRSVRVLSRRAIRRYADPRIGYREGIDEVVVHAARTRLPDGTVLPVPPYSRNVASPGDVAGWPGYADWRERILSFSGIDEGVVLDLDYEVITKPGADPWLAEDLRLSGDDPVRERVITITVPEGTPYHHRLTGAETTEQVFTARRDGKSLGTHRYVFRDLPATRSEAGAPPWPERAGRFLFTTCPGAKAWVARLLDRVERAARGDDAVLRFAREAVKGARSPREKLSRLAAKIRATFNLTDSARARRSAGAPSAPEILRRNYGTIGDAAALFQAAARGLGEKVVPEVAVDADLWSAEVPADSAVRAVTLRRGEGEGALRFHPLDGLIRARDPWTGRRFLGRASDGSVTVFTPRARPALLRAEGDLRLGADGKLAGELRLTVGGEWFDPAALDDAQARKRLVDRLASRLLTGVAVESFLVTELKSDSLCAKLTIGGGKPAEKVRGRWLLGLGEGPLAPDEFGMPLARSHRRTAVRLRAPVAERVDLTIALPPGATATALPAPVGDEGSPVREEVRAEGARIRILRELRLPATIPAKTWEGERADLVRLRARGERFLLVKPR